MITKLEDIEPLPLEEVRRDAADYGIATTPEGLIVPGRIEEELDTKIAPSIAVAADRLGAARATGKTILYLPGSYDLVHVGHFSYIEQAIEHHLRQARQEGQSIGREDLFVAVLADDDELLGHIKQSKQIKYGGSENFARPIERFNLATGRHPRLDALATLPVDLTALLPGPTAPFKMLPRPQAINLEACQTSLTATPPSPAVMEHVTTALARYPTLVSELARGESPGYTEWWQLGLWQLYLTAALVPDLPHPGSDAATSQVKRMISHADTNYSEAVALYMRFAGISVETFIDRHVLSTTDLLETYGPDYLLASKR